MTKFIFDLQRFDGTTWTLTAAVVDGTTTYKLTAAGKTEISKATLTELFSDETVVAGDTIKLGEDITESKIAGFSKNLTLDLNGHTLARDASLNGNSGNVVVNVTGTNTQLTITDSSETGTGKIDALKCATGTTTRSLNIAGTNCTVNLEKVALTGGEYGALISAGNTLTMNSGSIEGSQYAVDNRGTFNMSGGTVTSTATTFTGKNSDNEDTTFNSFSVLNRSGATFTMSGGTVNSDSKAIYGLNNSGTATISGGTLNGSNSSLYNAGTATITGGIFSEDVSGKYNVNASDCKYLDGICYVGAAAQGETFDDSKTSSYQKITIDGVEKYYSTEALANAAKVASIGDKYYSSLQKAADAVQNGETITLLQDVTSGFEINNGYSFTLNLNEHKIETNSWAAIVLGSSNKSDTGGAYAATLANKLTITGNGTISSSAGAGIGIYGPYKQSDAESNHSQLIIGTANGNDAINISGSDFGIFGNGIAHYADITVNTTGTISGGTASGIYNPQLGTLTINSGTITGGESGIEFVRASLMSLV